MGKMKSCTGGRNEVWLTLGHGRQASRLLNLLYSLYHRRKLRDWINPINKYYTALFNLDFPYVKPQGYNQKVMNKRNKRQVTKTAIFYMSVLKMQPPSLWGSISTLHWVLGIKIIFMMMQRYCLPFPLTRLQGCSRSFLRLYVLSGCWQEGHTQMSFRCCSWNTPLLD